MNRGVSSIYIRKNSIFILFISLIILLIVSVTSLFFGTVKIPVHNVLSVIGSQIPGLGGIFRSGYTSLQQEIITQILEPEIIGAIVIGATLGVGGAAIQSIFKNPITEPYMIGISSGAALGAVISISLGVLIFGVYTLQVLAFVFSIAIVGLIYFFSFRRGRVPIVYMLLTGIAVSVFVSSIVAFLLYTSPNLQGTSEVYFWLMGSLNGIGWKELFPVLVTCFISILAVSLFAKELDIIQLGEEYARTVGVRVELLKVTVLMLVTLSVAAAVSISGLIGFVGLVVPHISRLIHGGSNRKVIPSSAIFGAIFLVLSYNVSRLVLSPVVIPIGIVTGLIGVPFFIYLLRRLAGGYYAD